MSENLIAELRSSLNLNHIICGETTIFFKDIINAINGSVLSLTQFSNGITVYLFYLDDDTQLIYSDNFYISKSDSVSVSSLKDNILHDLHKFIKLEQIKCFHYYTKNDGETLSSNLAFRNEHDLFYAKLLS